MTRKQAQNLLDDLRKTIPLEDYREDVYLSIRGVGSKRFKRCAYFDTDSWIFLWTLDDSFVFNKKDVGDFVFVPTNDVVVHLKKEKSCY